MSIFLGVDGFLCSPEQRYRGFAKRKNFLLIDWVNLVDQLPLSQPLLVSGVNHR